MKSPQIVSPSLHILPRQCRQHSIVAIYSPKRQRKKLRLIVGSCATDFGNLRADTILEFPACNSNFRWIPKEITGFTTLVPLREPVDEGLEQLVKPAAADLVLRSDDLGVSVQNVDGFLVF